MTNLPFPPWDSVFISHYLLLIFLEYWLILALFYYPALYYPLLACGTLHITAGYVLGSLLSWTHFGILIWHKVDCPKTPQVGPSGCIHFINSWTDIITK